MFVLEHMIVICVHSIGKSQLYSTILLILFCSVFRVGVKTLILCVWTFLLLRLCSRSPLPGCSSRLCFVLNLSPGLTCCGFDQTICSYEFISQN